MVFSKYSRHRKQSKTNIYQPKQIYVLLGKGEKQNTYVLDCGYVLIGVIGAVLGAL